jgi:hypothetical protein
MKVQLWIEKELLRYIDPTPYTVLSESSLGYRIELESSNLSDLVFAAIEYGTDRALNGIASESEKSFFELTPKKSLFNDIADIVHTHNKAFYGIDTKGGNL